MYRGIRELSEELGEKEHVIRYWEKELGGYIAPRRGEDKRRYYGEEDIRRLKLVRDMIRSGGYTLRGVKRHLQERGMELERVKLLVEAKELRREIGKLLE